MIVFAVGVVGVSSGGEEWEDVVVLLVVDGGIGMVIGSRVGCVLPDVTLVTLVTFCG